MHGETVKITFIFVYKNTEIKPVEITYN